MIRYNICSKESIVLRLCTVFLLSGKTPTFSLQLAVCSQYDILNSYYQVQYYTSKLVRFLAQKLAEWFLNNNVWTLRGLIYNSLTFYDFSQVCTNCTHSCRYHHCLHLPDCLGEIPEI